MGNHYHYRRCPKCGGNMYMDKDYNGWYEQCLQCSFIHDMPVMYEGKAKTDSAGSKKMETGK